MPLLQPCLNLFGPLPSPGLESGLQLRQNRTVDLRWLAAAMLTLQQPRHAASFERVDPVKELAAAHADLSGNLRSGELPAGGQAHGQQSLVKPDVFAIRQCCCDRSGKIGSLQLKSLRHVFICHAP